MPVPSEIEQAYVHMAKELGEVKEGAQFFRVVELAIQGLPEDERRVAAGLLMAGAACWAEANADYTAELARTVQTIFEQPIRTL